MTKLVKTIGLGVAWTTLSNVGTKMIGVVYIAVVLSQLSVYEYGLTELVITMPALMGLLALPGLERVVIADMARAKGAGNAKKMMQSLTSYFSLRFVLGVLAFLILFSAADLIESYYNTGIANMIRVISATFLFNPIRSVILILLKVDLNFAGAAGYRFVEELVKLLIVSVALLYYDLGPLAVILAYVGTDVVSILLLTPTFLGSWRSCFSDTSIGQGWRSPFFVLQAHGKWGVFESYMAQFGQNIRPWIIKLLLGTQAVGIYGVAQGLFQHTASLLPISKVITPIVPRFVNDQERLLKLLHSSIKYQMLSSIISLIVVASLMPILISNFFPAYGASYGLYLALLPALIPSSMSAIFQPTFHAFKAQRSLFTAAIVRLVSICVFLPLSILGFGIWGIAVEFFITRAIYNAERYRKIKQMVTGFSFRLGDILKITDVDILIYQKIVGVLKRTSVSLK